MREFHVAIVLERASKAWREKTAGVLSFAGKTRDWETHFILPNLPRPRIGRALNDLRPDGIIGSSPIRASRLPCPLICIDDEIGYNRSICTVNLCCDNAAISGAAAECLLQHGFRQCAYVGTADASDCIYSDLRYRHFAEAVRKGGGDPRVPSFTIAPFSLSDRAISKKLEAWLLALPKPCGLFVYQDFLCQTLMVACHRAGLKVPEQLGIIGVDNELEICENADPTLSSIEPDFFGAGYRAAELLDRFMRKGPPRKPILQTYGIKDIHERMSTQNVAGPMRVVAAARERIRLAATEGLTVAALAAEFGISPRMLEYRFRDCLGTSVRDEIINVRLDAVKRMLSTTNVPLGEIAAETGFGSSNHLKAVFRNHFGMTMRDYRKRK